nr:AAC(3) family N-acetyltransferase [uncultured Oscillibacter sp.]
MENIGLFSDSAGRLWTREDVLKGLRAVGADACEILFVHTALLFGRPNRALGRKGYLQALYEVLLDLQVPTLVFPAFSYSFANHENYDVRRSRTSMGALVEYIRTRPEVCRSLDPLLSLSVAGARTDLTAGRPTGHSFGPDSGFDRLHRAGNVKFLFLGADFAEHFTYIHYIEKVLEVPYRFDMFFTGNITGHDGQTFRHTQAIHTQCGGVKLKNIGFLKSVLAETGHLKVERLGDGELACIAEEIIFQEVAGRIRRDPFSLVEPYTERDLTHIYTFGKDGERVTHC